MGTGGHRRGWLAHLYTMHPLCSRAAPQYRKAESLIDLLPQEQELVESAKAGKILNLRGRSETVVRGSVLRDLVVNSEAHGVDPMGILLQGADVLELDLADIEGGFKWSCRHRARQQIIEDLDRLAPVQRGLFRRPQWIL